MANIQITVNGNVRGAPRVLTFGKVSRDHKNGGVILAGKVTEGTLQVGDRLVITPSSGEGSITRRVANVTGGHGRMKATYSAGDDVRVRIGDVTEQMICGDAS
jgi:translation elongation factor EF-1alpha